MTRRPLLLLFTVLLGGSRLVAQGAPAIPPTAVVAWVSAQRVAAESNAGKAGTARLQQFQQERGATLRAQQQALVVTRQQLATAATPGERTQLAAREATERADVDRLTAQFQLDLQNLQRELNNDLRVKVGNAVREVVSGTRIEVVLNQDTAVLWSVPGLDLTAAVIAKIDSAKP